MMQTIETDAVTPQTRVLPSLAGLRRRSRVTRALLLVHLALTILLLAYNLRVTSGASVEAMGPVLAPAGHVRLWEIPGLLSCEIAFLDHYAPRVAATWLGVLVLSTALALWSWTLQASRAAARLYVPCSAGIRLEPFSRAGVLWSLVPVVGPFVLMRYVWLLWRCSAPGRPMSQVGVLPQLTCVALLALGLTPQAITDSALVSTTTGLAIELCAALVGLAFVRSIDARLHLRRAWVGRRYRVTSTEA